MNNILDEVLNNAAHPAVVAPAAAHSFTRGATITASGVRHVEQFSDAPYRGLGTDVTAAANDPVLIAGLAGMDWQTVPMPLAIKGKTEYRDYSGMVALVRSDTEEPLAVATESYHPHQNGKLLKTMCDFADESGLTLARVGLFNHGSRGFAVATSGVNREAGVGDVVTMHIVLKFGHAPGMATTIMVWANELRCSNGACVRVDKGRSRFVHSAELTPGKIEEAHEFVRFAAEAFAGHIDKLVMLRGVASNKGIDLMQLAELFQPKLAAEISLKLQRITNTSAIVEADHEHLGARVLTSLLEREASVALVSDMVSRHSERLLSKVISATLTQPGGEMTVGTMAHAYGGVTHFNSNLRGRTPATGVEANLFGTSQADTQRALQLAVDTAGRVRAL